MPDNENGYLTRREAELMVDTGSAASAERLDNHRREHNQEGEALDRALTAEKVLRGAHDVAHAAAHESHDDKHNSEGQAVRTALAAVDRERIIHAGAHEREHTGHQREHALANLAIEKAESATDKRFASTNAYREQINDMIRNLASRELVDGLVKDVDRRFEEQRKDTERRHEELRHAIATLERTDVKAEGRGLGQGAVVAYIVTAFGLISVVLGIVIVLSNVLTSKPI